MKIAAMFANGSGGTVDRPDPQPVEDFVLVKIRSVPMCTEYKSFKREREQDAVGFGHEAAGEVVEVAQSGRVKVGDRVVVQPGRSCGTCWLCLDGEHIHCQTEDGCQRAKQPGTPTLNISSNPIGCFHPFPKTLAASTLVWPVAV